MSRVTAQGTIPTRRDVIDSLAAGESAERMSLTLGYSGARAVRNRLRAERLARQQLPCGVPVIIANAKPSEPT